MKRRTTLKGKDNRRKAMAFGNKLRQENPKVNFLPHQPSLTNHARHVSRQMYRRKLAEVKQQQKGTS